ncbi:putative metal-binding motif-containing protein [Archangium violaceum]|uniref:putative metal-binding motif-containing protein n=1 Tax=Archangium violaceum TaxID=83451 RepID=UPI001EF0FADF|nr:putative metal-binding motif-containing protein [Archangium violaceum]
MRTLGSALLGLTLAACGPAMEGEEGVQEQEQTLEAGCTQLGSNITNHACTHDDISGDHVSVTATSGLTSATPSISTTHKYYDVTMPSGAAGTVKFRPSAAGSWAFYRSQNVSITVKDSAGTTINPALSHAVSSSCSLVTATLYDLTRTTTDYQVTFGAASGNLLGVVPERLEDNRVRYYQDADGDAYGNSSVSVYTACVPPAGYILQRFDCNDANASINPSATELTGNSVDENCNGSLTN